MDRTERFYKIQSLLKSGAPVTMRQMQDKLEVSRATLNRDLAYMRDRLNVPIAWDAGQHGYVLTRQPGEKGAVELPGVWFNQQEIHSVLTMLELIAQLEPGGVLASQMAPAWRDYCNRVPEVRHRLRRGSEYCRWGNARYRAITSSCLRLRW